MNDKLRVVTLFTGYGSQEMALRNIGVDFEVVAYCEIDKYAIASYEAVHGNTDYGKGAFNLGDIAKVDPKDVPDHDLLTYSFPCTDISVSGLGKGFKEGSGTSSSLLWYVGEVIEQKKPKYLRDYRD